MPSTWVIFSRYKLGAGDTALPCVMPRIESLILQKAVCVSQDHITPPDPTWAGTQDLTCAKLNALLRTTASLRLFPYMKTEGSFQGLTLLW